MKSFPPQPPSVLIVGTIEWKSNKTALANCPLPTVLNPEFCIQLVLNVSALLIPSRTLTHVNAPPDSLGTMIAPSAWNQPFPPVLKAHIF